MKAIFKQTLKNQVNFLTESISLLNKMHTDSIETKTIEIKTAFNGKITLENKYKKGKYIYRIYFKDHNVSNKKLIEAFQKVKEGKQCQYKMAKINFETLDVLDKTINTLYVGSSANIEKRLNEHLGFGSKSTYALHLNKWNTHLKQIHIEVLSINLSDVTKNNKAIHRFVLENVEQGYWDYYNPLFGKRSGL